jgi:flagella basal body P-ring formation protein FlgA
MLIAMFKFSLIFFSMLFVSKQAIALSGEDISKKISEWLITENVSGEPIFSKKSIYKDCSNDLKMTRPFHNYKTIKVSCPDQNGFEVLVRIKTKNILPIKTNIKNTKKFKSIKLKRALEKNDVIELSDLDLVVSKKSSNNSFYNNKKDLVGRKIKQNLKMGQLLHPRHLYEKFDIQSGDYLSIVSSVGTASVVVSGKALDSGNLGDLIKVQNLRSGSVIKGYVKKNKIIKVYR